MMKNFQIMLIFTKINSILSEIARFVRHVVLDCPLIQLDGFKTTRKRLNWILVDRLLTRLSPAKDLFNDYPAGNVSMI